MASDTTPKKTRSAALRHRGGRRIAHPLLDDSDEHFVDASASGAGGTPRPVSPDILPETPSSYSTPVKGNRSKSMESPLLHALEMAARPSPPRDKLPVCSSQVEVGTPSAPISYESSIEAMARHVEDERKKRSAANKQLSGSNGLFTSSPRRMTRSGSSTSLKRMTRSGSSTSLNKLRKKGSSGSATPKRKREKQPPKSLSRRRKMSIAATVLILPFVICEAFLGILVFCFRESVSALLPVVVTIPESDTMHLTNDLVTKENMSDASAAAFNNKESPHDAEGESADADVESDPSYADESLVPEAMETLDEAELELKNLRSMLEQGFSYLTSTSDVDYDTVDALCGQVWIRASEILVHNTSTKLKSDWGVAKSHDASLELLSNSPPSQYKTLALDAQRCLGGSGLSAMTPDTINLERLKLSTKIFDRLVSFVPVAVNAAFYVSHRSPPKSIIEPLDAAIRAGLGTALLLQGIFYYDYVDSGEAVTAQNALLKLALYHLKVASTMYSAQPDVQAPYAIEQSTQSGLITSFTGQSNDDGSSHAHSSALNNLALAYIALGDNDNSVPVLLRSASIRRESNSADVLYWNAHHKLISNAETKAMLTAVKNPSKSKAQRTKNKRRQTSFLRRDISVDDLVGI